MCLSLAAIGIIYTLTLFYAARNYSQHVTTSFKLRGENLDLIDDLHRSNSTLQGNVEEHQQTLNELRESERRFRSLIDGSIQGILIHRDWKPLFANQSFINTLGFDSEDELLNMESLEHLFSSYELKRLEAYKHSRATPSDTLVQYEVDAVRKNGTVVTLQSAVRSVVWDGIPAIQISVIDITDRIRTARALHRVEETYRQIFSTITDATILFDADSLQIVDANPAALSLYGFSWDEFLTKKILDISADPEDTAQAIANVRKHKHILGRIGLHRRKNEEVFPIEVSVSSFILDDRNLVCAIVRDISKRVDAENALRRSEERFRDFAETAADFFWETNAAMRYTYVSERYQEVTGLSPNRLLGHTRDEVFASMEDQDKWRKHVADLENHRPFKDLEVTWVHPDDGTIHIFRNSAKPIFNEAGSFTGYRGVVRNVTEAYNLSKQLTYQASHDSLTSLVNRAEFENRLQRLLTSNDQNFGPHVLCYLDLDQFKLINDTCGHAAGDELLRQMAALLQARVRKSDTLARLGGDEFAVLMENCSLDKAREVADNLRHAIEDFQFLWDNNKFNVGVSIGVVPINDPNERYAELLRAADSACYAAKDMGRNRVHVYHVADQELAKREGEMQWVARLNNALAENRFQLNFQTIAPASGQLDHGIHYELLLRMIDERGQLIPPGGYLPAAERYNLVTKLDRWVVNEAVEWLYNNPEHFDRLHLCSINLSGHSLGNEEFMNFIVAKLQDSRIDGHKLCFEITETAAIANLASATRFIHELKKLGCQFSLDDFGSGLSSFAYLKNLPVDFLKIDGLFVRDIVDDPIDFAMVKSINEIGKVMGKKTIAEFVESQAIARKLKRIGVDYLQGHYIGIPQPLENMPAPRIIAEIGSGSY